MNATIVSSSSERAQRRLDPAFHLLVQQHADEIARVEQAFSPEEMVSLATEIAKRLDMEGWRHLLPLTRSSLNAVDKDRILRGIQEDPSLGLVLTRNAAAAMVSRVERDMEDQQVALDAVRISFAAVDQRVLPLKETPQPQSKASSPRP